MVKLDNKKNELSQQIARKILAENVVDMDLSEQLMRELYKNEKGYEDYDKNKSPDFD